MVTDDVFVIEIDGGDAVDVLQDAGDFLESLLLPARQVDQGDVTRDDGLRVGPEAGQEHLHLFGGGVLSLIENDEAVI
jgi:hypothetical protein